MCWQRGFFTIFFDSLRASGFYHTRPETGGRPELASMSALPWRGKRLAEAFWHSIALALHGVLGAENRCILPKISAQIEKSSISSALTARLHIAALPHKSTKQQARECNYEPS